MASKGKPFNKPNNRRFPTARHVLNRAGGDSGETPRSREELEIIHLESLIRDRPQWWLLLDDEQEVRNYVQRAGGSKMFEVFRYALAECRWQACAFAGPIRPGPVDGSYTTENLPDELVKQLLAGCKRIRRILPRDCPVEANERAESYIPFFSHDIDIPQMMSNGATVNILDPCLCSYRSGGCVFCEHLVEAGRDRFVADGGISEDDMCDQVIALPSEFRLSSCGRQCEINSPINYLHPKLFSEFYDVISQAFVEVAPIFEAVLSNVRKISCSDPYVYEWPLRIPCTGTDTAMSSPGSLAEQSNISNVNSSISTQFPLPSIPEAFSLRGKPIQVFVGIKSIELTPEKPLFKHMLWDFDGISFNNVVATVWICLEQENLGEVKLKFRSIVNPFNFDRIALSSTSLCEVQPRGECTLRPHRAIAWPTTFQHCMQSVTLLDPTRKGRCTILSFSIVDPLKRIRSTATVPPPTEQWLGMNACVELSKGLPQEVVERICSFIAEDIYKDAYSDRREGARQLIEWMYDGRVKIFLYD